MTAPFKTCPFCSTTWSSRETFLADEDLSLVGYQVDFDELDLGLFLFNHGACRTTLAIRANLLKDLYIGPVFAGRRTGEADCPGYCLRRAQLDPCPAHCECAWVRRLLQIIRQWPKASARREAAAR